jgi:DNA-binding NarL/FixJ family response regulator
MPETPECRKPPNGGDRTGVVVVYNGVVTSEAPVRVAVVNDYELIIAGLEQMLQRYPDRVTVRERIIVGEPLSEPVQVALYDLYGRVGVAASAIRTLADDPQIGVVAVFSLDLGSDLIAEGRAAGAQAFISKALPGDEVADAVVRAARGEPVVSSTPAPRPASSELLWPGKEAGLSERESQALALLADGLSNREIAAALYLSAETVKGYLAAVFAKLGVRNRVEAAIFVHRTTSFEHSGSR